MNGIVPYNFEDEFFEEELESAVLPYSQAEGAYPPDTPKVDHQILEDIKAVVARCVLDSNIQGIGAINDKISTIERQLNQNTPSEPQVLLKIFNAFHSSLLFYSEDALTKNTRQNGIKGMQFCIDCLKETQKSSGEKDASSEFNLVNACNLYFDFQNSMPDAIQSGHAAQLSDPDALLEKTDTAVLSADDHPEHSSESPDNIPLEEFEGEGEPIVESGGFWAKVKGFFGFS